MQRWIDGAHNVGDVGFLRDGQLEPRPPGTPARVVKLAGNGAALVVDLTGDEAQRAIDEAED